MDRERLLEIIDRRDKWGKFIGPTIPDTHIAFAVDDVSDIFCDGSYRSKYRTYPEKITDKDEQKPDEIRHEDSLEDIRDKSSLWCILTESSEAK